MNKIFTKNNIVTVPNLLSIIRLLLIPIIVWLYIVKHNYYTAIIVIIISGITDVVDGIIARKFNMVSDFGKILDPIADKLTQASLIICLAFKHKLMLGLLSLFAMRETAMSVLGIVTIKKTDIVCSAKWYGKLNTVVLYSVIVLLVLLPDLSHSIANILIIVSAMVMLITFILYVTFYKGFLSQNKNNIRREVIV